MTYVADIQNKILEEILIVSTSIDYFSLLIGHFQSAFINTNSIKIKLTNPLNGCQGNSLAYLTSARTASQL